MSHVDDGAIGAWMSGRLPAEWQAIAAPDVVVDREEIVVTVTITEPATPNAADGADGEDEVDGVDAAARAEVIAGRIAGFREDTRERRMAIAREAEHRFGRKVAWGVRAGERTELFTHLAAPVMTRLRQPERRVLDTLVATGVARSRADALAWCVRLVGRHADTWLADLRSAMADVERLRTQGPDAA